MYKMKIILSAIQKLFDIDILRLDYIGYNEIYKKYGDKHLNQK